MLLGKALCLQAGPCSQHLFETPALTTAAGAARTEFDHDGSSLRDSADYASLSEDKRVYRGKKVIFLARDVRDVLVSSYYETTRRAHVFEGESCRFDGTLSEFVRSPVFGARKVAAFYSIWSRSLRVPSEFLLIRYEQLHRSAEEVLAAVLQFIGAEVERRHIAAAVAFARFENMRELERTNAFDDPRLRPGEPSDPDSYKVRRGAVGGYRDYLSDADVAYIGHQLRLRGFPFGEPSQAARDQRAAVSAR